MSGLRDRVKARWVREGTWMLVTKDPTQVAAKLREAQQAALLAGVGKPDNDPIKKKLDAAVKKAERELAACSEKIRFRGLPADELETLQQAHPPKPGVDDPKAGLHWPSYFPALCSACQAPDDEADRLTPDEWADIIKSLTVGDARDLSETVNGVNTRPASEGIPKD